MKQTLKTKDTYYALDGRKNKRLADPYTTLFFKANGFDKIRRYHHNTFAPNDKNHITSGKTEIQKNMKREVLKTR